MTSELTSSKIQNTLRENEEKKTNERKRNLLYLISNYLSENGFVKTTEAFFNEAQLSKNIELCDNIDLDIVLQEYFSYYFFKFKRYPKLTRKANTVELPVKSNTPNKMKNHKKIERNVNDEKSDETHYFTITPLSPQSNDDKLNTAQSTELFNVLKPLYECPGFHSSEWKELANLISKEIILRDLNVRWNDIKGLDNVKNLLKEAVVYPLQYPHLFDKLPVPWKGVLIYGPPGTGKTFLAKALASECHKHSVFFNMTASSLISKWRGESEKLIRVLFDLAKYQAPSTIFIDEIDALVARRDECNQHEASRRFKSELLIQMDGINNNAVNDKEKVFLLATSNLPWNIDPAILRRFEKRILIDYPSVNVRCDMFKYYLIQYAVSCQNIEENDLMNFAKCTEGYTGSDIKLICKEASLCPIREEINKQRIRNTSAKSLKSVSKEHVLEAIQNTKPSTKYLADKYYKWHEEFGCI